MARTKKKGARSHAPAARAGAKSQSKDASNDKATALGAAAVAAAFGDEEDPTVDQDVDEQDGDDTEGGLALSRGQRKRLKRREAFMKKMGLVNRVTQENAKESKKKEQGAFADLEDLQASLFQSDKEAAAIARSRHQSTNQSKKPAAAAVAAAPKKQLSGKQRQKLAVRELGHLKAVHTHPSFQGNAFAAIQMHLQNTVVQANQANLDKTNAAQAKKQLANSRMDTE